MSPFARHSYSTKQVFSRFNAAVATVLILVIIIALVLATTHYFKELQRFKQRSAHQLAQQAERLNDDLSELVRSMEGLHEFAHYQLNNHQDLMMPVPPLAQDGSLFYLDLPQRDVISQRKQISANITGTGDRQQITPAMQRELAMAYALTPSFVIAQHNNPTATWFYYVSEHHFVSLYPWVGRETWHYSEKMTSQRYIEDIKRASATGQLYWSKAFEDTAGKGMMASLASGVYQEQDFVGALVIDINLALLRNSLQALATEHQGLVLLDKDNHVLVNQRANATAVLSDTTLADVLPASLAGLTEDNLATMADNGKVGDWLVNKKSLPINGWLLLQYQPYDDFILPLSQQFLSLFAFLFSSLIAFMVFIYWLTRKTFIKPATEFIQHIEYCAEGDPGKIKPSADWQHWFKIVEDIFGQNRSLLQQLKDQNNLLDQRVNEKTAELQRILLKHQRDYALLRSVMNAIPELIVFTDPQGMLIGCNSAVESYLQQAESEMLETGASELMPGRLGQALQKISSQAYQDERANAYQNVVWDNNQTFELYSCKFFNEQGQALGTINIFRDVTSQYETQSALEHARDQAENANKAKSQFLANMSHEIRTPLNAIQGMMFLLGKTGLNTIQHQYLHNAEIASKSLMYLIDELLDLARIESGKISLVQTEVELDSIIEKALKLNVGAANQKHLQITVDVAADVPQLIISDEIRLVQVLTNLLNNAVKFTDQGEVRLTISCTGSSADNALVKFSVSDTGIGIAKDKQAKLFEAFTQADESMTRKYGGSGLGLSICKQIVNLLGGDINLKSDVGAGSEFSFVLPLKYRAREPDSSIELNIYTLGFALNDAVIAMIAREGWHYCQASGMDELLQLPSAEHNLLLLDMEQLLDSDNVVDLHSDNWHELSRNFSDFGLCHPMMSAVNDEICTEFERQGLSWFIVEKPVYRSLLSLIARHRTATPEPVVTAALPEQKAEHNLAGISVLLVEDNLVNQMVAKELLLSMQAEVFIADNGEKALAMLAQQSIDVVLMDIQMPVMDGLTASREIRKNPQWAELPIIAMTAHAREHDHQQSLQAGMNRHISKPVSHDVLLQTILSVLPAHA